MNPDHLTELLQKGFRVTLGATGALVESLQDSQKRDENLSKMQSDFGKLTEEWADKGAVTELEARNFVDALWTQQANSQTTAAGDATVTTSAESVAEPDVQADVEALTAQLAALRAELENLKSSDSKDSNG